MASLHDKLQKVKTESVNWLSDNGMCVAGHKTKLLLVGTPELKRARSQNLKLDVRINNDIIIESPSERLLGLTISNNMTWTH